MTRKYNYDSFQVQAFENSYVAGLDIGQKSDSSALALIELRRIVYDAKDPCTWQAIERTECKVVHAERIPLNTPYPDVVRHACNLLNSAPHRQEPALVIDATGVGAAVVDLFRTRHLTARMVPVVITGGDSVTEQRGTFRVPKRDLISGLQVAFDNGTLLLAENAPELETFIRELMSMRSTVTARGHERFEAWREGEHDDLVLAVALAWWWLGWTRRADSGQIKFGEQPYRLL